MKLCVVHCSRFIIKTVVAAILTVACLQSVVAPAQELTAQQPPAAETDSAAEVSKQAANPLASAWVFSQADRKRLANRRAGCLFLRSALDSCSFSQLIVPTVSSERQVNDTFERHE